MTPERYKQVCQICGEALALSPDQRETFLLQACVGDEELLREVESLLALQDQAENFIETRALDVAAQALAAAGGDFLTGKKIGRYDVLSLLGKGGMGLRSPGQHCRRCAQTQ